MRSVWQRVMERAIPDPLLRLTYADAMRRYGTDKPDLRFGLELIDLSEAFENTEVKAFSSPTVVTTTCSSGQLARTTMAAGVSAV